MILTPPMPRFAFSALAVLLLPSLCATAQPADPARLRDVRPELTLAGGRLHVANVYRAQALAIAETAGQPADSTVERLVRDAYAPYAAFWAGYLGGEDRFREWSREALLGPGSPLNVRLDAFLAVDLDAAFEAGAAWVEATTGHAPEGTWYLAFGPGWTDMGGLGGSTMVADLSKVTLDPARLPHLVAHELIHQVHGPSPARAGDPDRGTVLDRIVSEGLGTYAAYAHADGALTPAQALHFTDAEWTWAMHHEPHLGVAAAPLLASRERPDTDRVSSRGAHLLDGGPGAAGYFLGFRIVQAYEATHGPGSWAEIVDLPVREAVARSGYPYLPLAP